MKKVVVLGLLISSASYGQTNTFPSSGNVGIGTTSPNAKVEILTGTGSYDGLRLNKSTDTDKNWLSFWQGNGSSGVYRFGQISWGDGMALYVGATNPASPGTLIQKWNYNGYVGIGTATPTWKLHVKGAITAEGDGASGYADLNLKNGTQRWHISGPRYGENNRLGIFFHDGTSYYDFFTLTTSGNVGIGTSDPKGYKLAVAGKIVSEEIVVKLQANWPDYVFEKDYELPSLQELQLFIAEHHHLPGVPTAKEVVANGLSVGEMNAVLLKKIEELTLHLIELKNQIDNQNKVIEELKENR